MSRNRVSLFTTIRELPYKLRYDLRCLFGHHHDVMDDGRCSWCERQTR